MCQTFFEVVVSRVNVFSGTRLLNSIDPNLRFESLKYNGRMKHMFVFCLFCLRSFGWVEEGEEGDVHVFGFCFAVHEPFSLISFPYCEVPSVTG